MFSGADATPSGVDATMSGANAIGLGADTTVSNIVSSLLSLSGSDPLL
jgi:hypothetical protein